MKEATFVIIGGGIAGVSCAEGLSLLAPEEKVILISASPTIKAVVNPVHLSKLLTQFDVEEHQADSLSSRCPSVEVIQDSVVGFDWEEHTINTASGQIIAYEKVCICTGAKPKLFQTDNPRIIGIRDTDSVREFEKKLKSCRRILIVGNGGIATELVHELQGIEVIWAIKDKHISATFIDPGAAEFFKVKLNKAQSSEGFVPFKRMKYTVSEGETTREHGAALGPDWHSKLNLTGLLGNESKVTVEHSVEIKRILTKEEASNEFAMTDDYPVYALLTNDKIYGCDLIVSATGVSPNTEWMSGGQRVPELCGESGGIKVNWKMESSIPDVYAAGDVCTASWEIAQHWLQMRLWTQAHQMGLYAAKTMVAAIRHEDVLQDFCFELFTHVTKFFGMKVCLLGLFNGQTLDNNYEILLRVTKDVEYVKLILKEGRLQGAVLIGETDLEEMCENLILNQLDLTPFGEELLNPDIDIEDYFD